MKHDDLIILLGDIWVDMGGWAPQVDYERSKRWLEQRRPIVEVDRAFEGKSGWLWNAFEQPRPESRLVS